MKKLYVKPEMEVEEFSPRDTIMAGSGTECVAPAQYIVLGGDVDLNEEIANGCPTIANLFS